jgi:hypothetical protein
VLVVNSCTLAVFPLIQLGTFLAVLVRLGGVRGFMLALLLVWNYKGDYSTWKYSIGVSFVG